MKTAEEKAKKFFSDHLIMPNKTMIIGLERLLKEQDRDTRHACAEAVLQMDEPLDSSNAPSMAHNICMNVKAV